MRPRVRLLRLGLRGPGRPLEDASEHDADE